jgi:hypothetical protein
MFQKLKFLFHNILISRFPRIYELKLYLKYFFSFKKIFQKQLNSKYNIDNIDEINDSIFIPLLETSHYQFHQILILAKSLKIRGAKVNVLVCDSFLGGCELKSVKSENFKDVCSTCNFNQKHILDSYNLKFINYSSLFTKKELIEIKNKAIKIYEKDDATFFYEKNNITNQINDSITRYFYGGSARSNIERKNLYIEHLNTYITGFEASKKIKKTFNPNIILSSMAVYSMWSPFYDYFKKFKKVKCQTITLTQFNYNSVLFNVDDLYHSNDRFLKFKQLVNGKLNSFEKEEIDSIINNRKTGNADIFKDLKFFEKKSENLLKLLNIDSSKNNIFLFSNVFWDVGMVNYNSLFDSIVSWVLETVLLVSKDPKSHLYIKIHPAEVFDSSKSVKGIKDFIFEKFPILPKNLTIIYPEMKISPYELFPFIDIGVVYNGTIGMEMLYHGIPVISVGQCPYGNLNLSNDPTSRIQYSKMLKMKNIVNAKHNEVQLFAYFYFIKTCIPWNLTKSAYANDFKGFTFDSLKDILPGKNKYLDHLSNCILKTEETIIEDW